MSARRALLVAAWAFAGCAELAGVRELRGPAVDAAAPPDAAADACTDTRSDPESCGACGHSCRGGACKDGECAAVALGSVPDTGDVTLAVDGQRLFVGIVGGQLLAVPVGGGELASITLPPALRAIAVDAADLFVATDTRVLRCKAKTCGLPQVVATGLGATRALATAGDDVYFISDDVLLRAPRTGADAAVAASGSLVAFVADTSALTFTRAGGVFRCAAGGCGGTPPTLLAAAVDAGALAVAGGDAIWVDGTTLRRAPIPSPAGPSQATDLATLGASAGSLIVSDTRVTWRELGARVAACARAGGAVTTLAEGDAAPVTDVVADATYLYWMTSRRRLMRLAR